MRDKVFYESIEGIKENLYRIAYAYCKNEQDALDIIHETVYKAYLNIRQLKHPEFFNTWITRILINCAIESTRKSKKLILLAEYEVADKLIVDAEDEKLIENINLYDAMDKLTDNLKSVIILRYFQDLTIAQIAQILECPEGTVKSYIHRAIKRLRKELEDGEISENKQFI
ncbi:MAG: sigma-70 family RNA polymerase sigma factor [Bacillota bacterium]|nr:sigma-70 family RNA polymerase sigma factor [Bacillota bacterium]